MYEKLYRGAVNIYQDGSPGIVISPIRAIIARIIPTRKAGLTNLK